MTLWTENEKVVIVAETGASHERSYARAIALIHAAARAGADAVKFSAFRPQQMTVDSAAPSFVIAAEGPWKGRTLYSLYEQSALPYDWIPDLKMAAQQAGLHFVLSLYHPDTVPLANDWGCRTIKVASFELAWPELIRAVAQSSASHVILSTGSATQSEIGGAIEQLAEKSFTLLHCVSAYPANDEDVNLLTILDMRTVFNCQVGLSDHTTGLTAAVAATVLGATVIEKHIKLDDNGLDASFAVFPDRFYAMVQACRQARKMMGKVTYDQPKSYHRKMIEGQMIRVVHGSM